jgi:hypothetical protein
MARRIRERFGNTGERLVAKAEEMIDDPATPPAVRVALLQFVADRGYGKPMNSVELVAHVAPLGPQPDYRAMTDDELRALADDDTPALAAPEPEDAEVVE